MENEKIISAVGEESISCCFGVEEEEERERLHQIARELEQEKEGKK
jgi:hypothetical protein